jgi:hypothetical protein
VVWSARVMSFPSVGFVASQCVRNPDQRVPVGARKVVREEGANEAANDEVAGALQSLA